MAARWIPCGSGFIKADVIRWTEAAWREPHRRRRSTRAVNTGERLVIAEVIDDDGEWVDLLVRDCTVASEMPGWKVEPLPKDAQLRRKRRTIERGRPERLLWTDEGVRALLVNRFLKADNPAPSGDDY